MTLEDVFAVLLLNKYSDFSIPKILAGLTVVGALTIGGCHVTNNYEHSK